MRLGDEANSRAMNQVIALELASSPNLIVLEPFSPTIVLLDHNLRRVEHNNMMGKYARHVSNCDPIELLLD
jgi:hypothetical protein